MHIATTAEDMDAIGLLLQQAPACVLIKDDNGLLPLDLAIEKRYLDATRLLRRATDEQRLLAPGSRPLDALKLFLCGDSGAGKTTLARALRNLRHDPLLDRTAGIDVKRAAFALRSGTSITLSLHDFAGHHQFHAMHELILAEPNAVFAVLVDASRPANTQRRHLLYWLRLIATRVSQAQRLTAQTETRPTVVVLGTHADHPAAEAAVLRSALGDALASSSGWSALLNICAEDLALVSCPSKKDRGWRPADPTRARLEGRVWGQPEGANDPRQTWAHPRPSRDHSAPLDA
jgi:signal recognition particle receptor subunit beta